MAESRQSSDETSQNSLSLVVRPESAIKQAVPRAMRYPTLELMRSSVDPEAPRDPPQEDPKATLSTPREPDSDTRPSTAGKSTARLRTKRAPRELPPKEELDPLRYLNSALPAKDRARLDETYERIRSASTTLAGYPCNQVFDYRELLPFLAFSMNNVGDPFADSNYRLNTHDLEREVLTEFSALTHASPKEVWGYVTSGGTEGNLYGLYLARELHPDGIVYYSEDTHYSVAKSLRLLRTRNIMIRSQENGEIDYEDLREALSIHRDVPPILFLNIGTTMKGAIDRVDKVRALLKDLRLTNHYIHCDAALSGMILPFVENPPPWDFAAGVDSLSISGHKMLGAPVPCGVVLARRKNVERIARSVEYVGVLDTTIGGSRSAFSPLVLWYALRRWGREGLEDLVHDCQDVAQYAVDRMNDEGIEAWKNDHSITVVLPRPTDELIRRFQIAPQGNLGHLITMPHVTRRLVDQFISEYLADPPGAIIRCARPSPGSHLRPGSIPPPALEDQTPDASGKEGDAQ